VTSVRDIDVHGNDLVIATHGRGYWIMDDVSPLRQRVSQRPYLFAPAATVRFRAAGFTGTPMPKDEPIASNPPAGAYIDYVLDSATPVTLEIFDAQNTLVRRYNSADAPPEIDPAKLRTAPEWFAMPVMLQGTPGMHRFVWPIRLAGTRGVWSAGIWAPPGDYRVVLTAGDRKLEQPLRIDPDPRVKVPMSAYAEQYVLAKQIDALRFALDAAVTESESLYKKATDDPMRKRIEEVAGLSATFGTTSMPNAPPPKTLRFYLTAIENVLDAVDGADAAPSPDAREGFARLKPEVERALNAWKEIAGK